MNYIQNFLMLIRAILGFTSTGMCKAGHTLVEGQGLDQETLRVPPAPWSPLLTAHPRGRPTE